jgi:hypothetical protein
MFGTDPLENSTFWKNSSRDLPNIEIGKANGEKTDPCPQLVMLVKLGDELPGTILLLC